VNGWFIQTIRRVGHGKDAMVVSYPFLLLNLMLASLLLSVLLWWTMAMSAGNTLRILARSAALAGAAQIQSEQSSVAGVGITQSIAGDSPAWSTAVQSTWSAELQHVTGSDSALLWQHMTYTATQSQTEIMVTVTADIEPLFVARIVSLFLPRQSLGQVPITVTASANYQGE